MNVRNTHLQQFFSFKIKNEAKNILKVENFYKKVLTNKTFYGIVIAY